MYSAYRKNELLVQVKHLSSQVHFSLLCDIGAETFILILPAGTMFKSVEDAKGRGCCRRKKLFRGFSPPHFLPVHRAIGM